MESQRDASSFSSLSTLPSAHTLRRRRRFNTLSVVKKREFREKEERFVYLLRTQYEE